MPYDMQNDPLYNWAIDRSSPALKIVAVTPSDSADLDNYAKAIWVYVPDDVDGGVATIRVTAARMGDGETTDIYAPPGLLPLPPCVIRKVWETGTTTGITIYSLTDR